MTDYFVRDKCNCLKSGLCMYVDPTVYPVLPSSTKLPSQLTNQSNADFSVTTKFT